MKTDAARLLERLGIPHRIRTYPVDPDDPSALRVGQGICLPAGQLFKTLVAKGERTGVHLAVVPGDTELDLKALSRVTGERSLRRSPSRKCGPSQGTSAAG